MNIDLQISYMNIAQPYHKECFQRYDYGIQVADKTFWWAKNGQEPSHLPRHVIKI